MARFLIQVALPLFAPLAVYIIWLWYAQKRAEKHGDEPPAFTKGSAFIAIAAGGVLAIMSLGTLALLSGHDASEGADRGSYVSPRLENGEIVGPHFEGDAHEDTGNQYRSD